MAEYAEREIMDQKHYAKHVMAMTVEKLHCKGDIAAELAHRDEYINLLEEALTDVLDGETAFDLIGMTGLSPTRCEELSELSAAIINHL